MNNLGRTQTLSTNFALTIVRNPFKSSVDFNKYLAVEEAGGKGWWIAGGALHEGETFQEAARRELLEEAGLRVDLKGVLRFM